MTCSWDELAQANVRNIARIDASGDEGKDDGELDFESVKGAGSGLETPAWRIAANMNTSEVETIAAHDQRIINNMLYSNHTRLYRNTGNEKDRAGLAEV